MAGAPATKKLKISRDRKIVHLDEFHLHSDCHYNGEIRANKNGRKFAALNASQYDPSKVLLQFNGGGSVPSFGIKIDNEHEDGNTSLIYNLSNETEVESLRKLTSDAIQLAIANKHSWWPKGITNDQIRDNLAPLFTEKKLKSSGEDYWPAQMKVKIPIDSVTGEAKLCDIKKNPDDSDVPFTDLPGSTWETLVVELSGFYFAGKYTWGIAKQLFKLQVASKKAEWDPKKVSFLPRKNLTPPLPTDAQIHTEYLKLIGELNQ